MSSSSASNAKFIILEYVCPILGTIIANIMYSAPYKDLQQAVAAGNLGDLNPTPWAFMMGNTFGWITYSILIQNYWIYLGSISGFLLSIWLNLGACKLLYQEHHSEEMRSSLVRYLSSSDLTQIHAAKKSATTLSGSKKNNESLSSSSTSLSSLSSTTSLPQLSSLTSRIESQEMVKNGQTDQHHDGKNVQEMTTNVDETMISTLLSSTVTDWAKVVWDVTSQRTPAPLKHETMVLLIASVWVFAASFIAFSDDFVSHHTKTVFVGILANLNLVFFYGAPLSTIWKVMSTKSSSSIHVPTVTANAFNGFFWTVYGFALNDFYVVIPNGLGAILGAIQLCLCCLFRKEASATLEKATKKAIMETTEESSSGSTTMDDTTKSIVLPGNIESTEVESNSSGEEHDQEQMFSSTLQQEVDIESLTGSLDTILNDSLAVEKEIFFEKEQNAD